MTGFLQYFNPKIWLHELQKNTALTASVGKPEVDRAVKGLANKKTAKSQLEWLKNETFLYWIVLKYAGSTKEYDTYVDKSRNSVIWYSFYANFHLKFWFEDLRREGKLKQGKKQLTTKDGEWSYEGEIDEAGAACGIGKAIRVTEGFDFIADCSFVNDQFEGVGSYAKK